MEEKLLTWTAPEYAHEKKSPDWYWALGIIVIALAITSYIIGNILLSFLILIAGFTIALYGTRHPETLECTLNKTGVRVNNTLYPYSSLEAFGVDETRVPAYFVLKSKKTFMPLIAIPIENIDPEDIRVFLEAKLKEEDLHEPVSQRIMEYLGF